MTSVLRPVRSMRGRVSRKRFVQHEQRQIDRAIRAQNTCERGHRGPATQTYERQV
jgi:hypothetical protein